MTIRQTVPGQPQPQSDSVLPVPSPCTSSTSLRACRVRHAGLVDYQTAWEWQRTLVAQRSAGECPDTLLLLEHPPTITLGRGADQHNILTPPDELQRLGVALVASDRGGDVTYHAPGQLVGYPILKLAHYGGSVVTYLRNLETCLIQVLACYDIAGRRVDGLTGVWVEQPGMGKHGQTTLAKVAAIGVRFSASGITSHGFALNVAPDLRGFAHIIPCGITEHAVTSLEALLGYAPDSAEVAAHVVRSFADVFGVSIITEETDETDETDTHRG